MNASTTLHSRLTVLDSRGRAVSNHHLLAGHPRRRWRAQGGQVPRPRRSPGQPQRLPCSASSRTTRTPLPRPVGSSTSRAVPARPDRGRELDGDHRRRIRGRAAAQGNLLRTLGRNVKLSVNLITQGSLLGRRDEVPDHRHSRVVHQEASHAAMSRRPRYASGGKSCERKHASAGRRPKPRRQPSMQQGRSSRRESKSQAAEPPRAKKTGKERAIRHASRVAKPQRVFSERGTSTLSR